MNIYRKERIEVKRGQKQTKPNDYVRNVDDLGRVSLPAPLRRQLGIVPGESKVRFEQDNGMLLIERYE